MAQTTPDVCPAFVVAAEGYDRLMGRYLPSLGPAFADAAGITSGMRVLDVGCGPGGLTGELARRVGAGAVAALDPSPPFVQACRERHPGVDVQIGVAEQLPFSDEEFDAALACLVVGFLNDAHAGVLEMSRVIRLGGTVAACFWDAANMPAIQLFWRAAAQVDPTRSGEMARLGSREGDLAALLTHAGLREVEETTLAARASYRDFDDWWTPIAQGIGPAGAYYLSLDDTHRVAVRDACEQQVGHLDSAFVLEARAWCVRGIR
jgi:ubiquinone/menaquinone biosynthesis C-methylase UbiE